MKKNKFQTELFKRDLEENGETYTDELSQKTKEITEDMLDGYDLPNVAVKKYMGLIKRIRQGLQAVIENPELAVGSCNYLVCAVFPYEWLEILKSTLIKKGYDCEIEKTAAGKNSYTIKIKQRERAAEDEKNNED